MQHSPLARRKLFEPAGELIQLPFSRQGGCLTPSWLLTAEARQRSLSIHSGNRSEEPQVFGLCWKTTSAQRGFEAAVPLQKRRSTSCANTRGAWQLVRWVAAQG